MATRTTPFTKEELDRLIESATLELIPFKNCFISIPPEPWPPIVVYDKMHRTPMFVDRDHCYWGSIESTPSDCEWMIGWSPWNS